MQKKGYPNSLRKAVFGGCLTILFSTGLMVAGAANSQPTSSEPAGQKYESEVPDTLDLAQRAGIALNGLAGTLDPDADFEIYFRVNFAANPPFMSHETTGLPTNNPKYAESFPMMRVMSGSDQFLDVERGMIRAFAALIGPDGLYYSPFSASRPWHEGFGHKYEDSPANEDFANVYGNSRALLAMIAWMQYEPEGPWRGYAEGIAKGLCRIAVKRDDYAYYPDSRIGEAFSYPKSGWKNTEEPQIEGMGAEGSMFMYHCGPIRALSRWYKLTGDTEARDVADRLVRFVTKRRFWGIEGAPKDIDSPGRGYYTGHMHGHTAMLFALIEYAQAMDNTSIKCFVRDGYDFARHHGITELGAWVNNQPDVEVCTISDMIGLAIKLTETGMGNYYDDVDCAVRNQLVESQVLRKDFLENVAKSSPTHEVAPKRETSDRVIERSLGIMSPFPILGYDNPYGIGCCTGNGTQALYYAWSKIVEFEDGMAKINLMLNRASPWVDIDSYLPYEGKVVLHNKQAEAIFVRVPSWLDRKKAVTKVSGNEVKARWCNPYLVIDGTKPGDRITLEFPLLDRRVDRVLGDSQNPESQFAVRLVGNTALEVSNGTPQRKYALYQREIEAGKTPMKKVERFVSGKLIDW